MAKLEQKTASYKILGVDPGTNLLGFAILRVDGKKLTAEELGVIKLSQFPDHAQRLQRIFERLKQVIFTHKPKQMAVEAPFFGKNAQSMLKLGRAQGVAIAAAMTSAVEVTEYSPRKIKQAITGNGNASKEQVSAMLEQELKMDLSNQLLDATDALATALCHYYQSRNTIGKGKNYSGWDAFLKDNPNRKI